MFRLMRLEDRIVLDGAAFTDALDEMQKQKLHEQQMFDADASDDAADAHDDVHYRSGIDTADPLFIVDDALVQDSSGTHVLVVSSKLGGADDLAAAVNDNVIVVKYDPAETSLKDLADTIRDALGGDQADSIAFASHNAGEGALGIGSEPISADSLAADAAQQEFWKTVGGSLAEDGRIDLLACSVVGTDAGEYLVSQIENISGANVAASSDATGNDAYGGDWVLESDDINIEATYFDSELLAHVEGVFGATPPVVANEIPDITVNWTGTDWPSINYKLPTLAGGTLFTDADGDALTYSVVLTTTGENLVYPTQTSDWLAYVTSTHTLIGDADLPPVQTGADYEITVTATDTSSNSVSQSFILSFRNPASTLPKATLSVSGSPMAEAGGVATVTATLDAGAPAGGASIVLGFGGDAESGDYTPSGGVISIAQGATSGFITLTANDDADSMDETVLVSIDSVSGAQEDGVQQVAATITDDEGSMPTVTLGISSTQIAEQGTPQNLTAYLSSAAPAGGITVNLDFTGTFDSGDYTAANSIFISAGNTAGSITVTANDDADLKNESLNISVLSSTDYAMGSPATVNATLVDNDYPSVTLSLSSTTFNEEGGTTNVIATLSEAAPAGADIYVSFAGTADAGQYTVTPAGTVITIGPGGSTGQLTLTGKSDTITEGDQTVVVDIVTATGAQEAGDQSVTATILDDDLVTVSLSASEATISEEGGATVVTATLNKQTSGGNVIVYLGYTGDAAAGTDYTGNAASISINYPNTTGSITLTGKHDTLIEGDESFVVDISSVLGASEGTPGSVPIAITDNDYSTVTLGISSPTFNEAGGSTQVTAYLDQPAGPGGVTVDLSYGGTADASDFSASPGSIFITAGSSSGSLTLTAENDGTVEGDESLTASISTITGQATVGTTSQVSATIVDDDAVYVSLDIDSATVSETGEGTALVTATLSKATDHDVTVGLTFSGTAVSGSDYSAAGNSIFISQGSTAGSIIITVADDSIVEGDETLTVNASSIVGASEGTPLSDSLTIIDNDLTSVTLGVSGSPFSENGGSADLVATLTAPSANNVIVDLAFAGSATFGTDYTAATSIFITAGSTTGSIALTGSDDAVAEYNETIVIDIVSVSGGAEETTAQQVTASITDDDVPVATLGISKTDIPEDGGVPGGTADVTVYLDRPAMAGGVVVNLTVSGTATQGDDYALSSTSFFIGSGATSKTRTIYVDNDTAFEGDETIVLSLGTVSGASKGTPDFINATISDDETAPGVALAFDKVTFAEGASAVVTATLDYVSDVPVTVDLSFSGTVETEDYNASASTIVISAGSLTGTVTIGAVDDTLYEGDEGITVDIANVVNATDGAAVAVSSTIIDSEQAPSLTLSLSPASFSENGGSAVVTATLDYASFEPVTVEFGFSGTAESNEYGASATSITITAGQTVGTITLSGIDDSMTEPEETIVVDVASLSGATEGSVTTVTASLLDDDNTPVVTLGLSSPTFLENGGTSLVVASLDHSTSETVTVDLGFTGTAGSSEYSYTANSIVITAGNTTGSIELSSIDDSDNENDETVVVNITAVSGASEAVAQTVSATIVDDDAAPGVTLAISKASFSEGGESAVVTATLAAATIDPVTVTLGFGGTADGSDYSYDASVITISAGDTSGSITITGEDDSAYEGDETLLVDIVAVEGATESGTQQVSATITDNDPAPTITLGIDDGALLENGGLEFITVYLNGDTELPVTVDLNFSGTAQLGIDYTASETSIVIDPTDSFYNIILSGSDDDVYEGNENIVLSVGAVEGATAGTPSSVTVTVTEDDGKPAVTLGVTSPFMEGSTTPAELTAYLSEASDVDSTINLVFSGTAETTDYNYSSAQIVITAGSTTGSIDLTSVDDSVFEGDETVAVSLGTLSDGLTAGTTTSATATLVDNDAVSVTLGLSVSSVAESGPGTLDIVAYLDGEIDEAITVDLTFSGTADFGSAGDYEVPTGIMIPAGTDTTGSVTLTAVDNTVYEGDETVVIDAQIDAPSSIAGVHPLTATITDAGDLPEVSLSFSNATFAESGGTTDVVLTLSKESAFDVTVDISYSGTAGSADYNGAVTSVVIPAGSMTDSFTLTASGDDLFEGDETVIVDVVTVSGGTAAASASAVASIIDDDGEPKVTLSVADTSLTEGASTVITATLDHPSGSDVTVELGYTGTAEASDYSAVTTLVISAGDTTGTVSFSAADDSIYEGSETLDISIVSVSGASEAVAQVKSITIADNDSMPGVTLALSPTSFAEDGGSAIVTATLDNPSALDVTVDLSFTGGTAEYGASSDFSASATYIVITAGQTTGTVQLNGVPDDNYEGDETAVVEIANVTNASEMTAQQVTATIDDSTDYPSVTLSVSPASFAEDGASASVIATLNKTSDETVTVDIAFSGTANASDYTIAQTYIVIEQGKLTGSVYLDPAADSDYEADETVEIDITAVENATFGAVLSTTATIANDDAMPGVTLSIDDPLIAETLGSSVVTATLSAKTVTPVTITLGFTGTAGLNTDYSSDPASITIPAGSTTGTFTIEGNADDLFEGTEGFTISVATVEGDATIAGANTLTASIVDDDGLPEVTLAFGTSDLYENSGSGATSTKLTAYLDQPALNDVTVALSYTGGTADSSDFSPAPATSILITAGSTTGSITLTTSNDGIYEGTETFIVEITDVQGSAAEGITSMAALTLIDDETLPTVTLGADTTIAEGATTAITATLSTATSHDVTVTLEVSGDSTATEVSDYSTFATQIVITAGNTTGSVSLETVSPDSLYEGTETFIVEILTVSNATEATATESQTVTITDTDSEPTVVLSWSPDSFAETGGKGSIVATLSGASEAPVTVDLLFTGGTATTADYGYTGASQIIIDGGKTTGSLLVSAAHDTVYELDESITVELLSVTGASEAVAQTVTATIIDDDATNMPAVTLSLDPAVGTFAEDGTSNMDVVATLDATVDMDVTVYFDFAGDAVYEGVTDYAYSASYIVISAGDQTGSITLTSADDASATVYEGSESVIVSLGTLENAIEGVTASVTATLEDPADIPEVTLQIMSGYTSEILEDGGKTRIEAVTPWKSEVPITVSLGFSNGTDVYATDYSVSSSTIVINANTTSGYITLTGTPDVIAESSLGEVIDITITGIANGTDAGTAESLTVTLLEDDQMPGVNLSLSKVTFSEAGGTSILTATMTQATDQDVTVKLEFTGAADFGTDYKITVGSSTITIPAGKTTGSITLWGKNDGVYEGDEAFTATVTATSANATAGTLSPAVLATVVDDETVPTVTLSWEDGVSSVEEDGILSLTAVATLSSPAQADVTVNLDFSGTANSTAATDYTTSASYIVIFAGNTSNDLWLNTYTDNVYEGDESVELSISSVVGASAGAANTLTGTITDDNDFPTLTSLTVSPTTFAEDGGVTDVTATISNPSAVPVTIDLAFSGTAELGAASDYTAPNPSIVIPGDSTSTSGSVTLYGQDDLLIEGSESVIVDVGTISNASDASGLSATATIVDDDNLADPGVTLSISDACFSEMFGTTKVTATLDYVAPGDVTVDLEFSGSVAEVGTDFTPSSPVQIFIPQGSLTGTVTLEGDPDGVYEGHESVVINLGTLDGATDFGGTAGVTATLEDADIADIPSVTLALSPGTATEGSDITLTAYLDGTSGAGITVDLVYSGSAAEGTDYTPTGYVAVPTQIFITAGNTSGTITLETVGDTVYEGDETLEVSITSVAGATLGATLTDSATIDDSADFPEISLNAQLGTFAEDGGQEIIDVFIDNGVTSEFDITVDLAFSGTADKGTDYNPTTESVVIYAGETTASFDLTPKLDSSDDAVAEGDESVIVSISTVTGGTFGAITEVTSTLEDDEGSPQVTLSLLNGTMAEDSGIATVVATLSHEAGADVTVQLDYVGTADYGDDFFTQDMVGIITIPAGSTTGTYWLEANPDNFYEDDETVEISIDDVSDIAYAGLTATVTATIVDDDDAFMPRVDLSLNNVTFDEDTGSTVVTATLSSASQADVTVEFSFSGTAGFNTDYTIFPMSTIVIPAGETTGTVQLEGATDDIYEGDEPVVVEIGTLTNATVGTITSVTASIDDSDDLPEVTLSVTEVDVSEGDYVSVTATLSNASVVPVTIDLAYSGDALWGTDYTTVPAEATSIVIPGDGTTLSNKFRLMASTDNLFEGTEGVVIDIATVGNGTEAATSNQVSMTILDETSPPVVSLSLSSDSFMEDGGSTVLTVSLDKATYEDVTVDLGFSYNSDAELGTDYTASATYVVITQGSTSAAVTLTGVSDTLYEYNVADEAGSERLGVTISAVNGGGAATGASGFAVTATIDDSEDLPSVTLSLSNGTFAEDTNGTNGDDTGGTTVVTATMSNPSEMGVTVNLAFSGDAVWYNSIDSEFDYRADDGIFITAGNTSGSVTLTAEDQLFTFPSLNGDPDVSNYEYQESVIVEIGSFSGTVSGNLATAGATAQVTATITDEEDKPLVVLDYVSGTFAENGGKDKLLAFLVHPQDDTEFITSAVDTTVNLSFTGTADFGTDYTAATYIVISAGSSLGEITLTGVDDSDYEGDETVKAVIAGVENGDIWWDTSVTPNQPSSATFTITDNGDIPQVSLSVEGSPFAEAGGTALVTATLTAYSADPVTVDLSFSGTGAYGTDYSADNTQIVIPANQLSASITLEGIDDSAYEGTETVVVDITTVTNASEIGIQQITASIADDDPMPTVTLSMSADSFAENGGSATVMATLDRISNDPVVVTIATLDNGTVVPTIYDDGAESSDYTSGTTTITINPGDLTGSVTLSAVDDSVYEGDETFTVEISTVSGGAESGNQSLMTTIVDDEILNIRITDVSVTEADEGDANPLATLTVQTAAGTTATDSEYPLAVDWDTQNVTATGGSDYTAFSGTVDLGGAGAGFTPASIQVQVLNDEEVEGNETFNVNLSYSTDPTTTSGIITDFKGVVTIVDDDQYAEITANTGITVDEMSTSVIDGSMLAATDDAPALGTDIVYTVSSGPTKGTLFIDADSSGTLNAGDIDLTVGGATFTQQDIDDGKVLYVHTGTAAPDTDSFTFTVENPSDTPANPSPASGTFTITILDVNQAPTANDTFKLVAENTTGNVQITNIDDMDGDTVTLALVNDYNGLFSLSTTTVDTGAGPGTVDVVVNGTLDYEYEDYYSLYVSLDDGNGGTGVATVVIALTDDTGDAGYTINPIPTQTVSSSQVKLVNLGDYYDTMLTGTYAIQETLPAWMTFYDNGLLIIDGTAAGATSASFTFNVDALFEHWNFTETAAPATSFTVDYIADLDTDALMDALYYLEGGEESELPAEGEVVDINQVMIASAEEPVYYEAPVAEGDAVADPELAEIIALLDQEAVISDPETQTVAGPDSETV